MVVGAHALGTHGVIRASLGFDLWVEPTPENAKRLWHAMKAFGAAMHEMNLSDFEKPGIIFQLGALPSCIHLMTSVTALNFEQAWERRTQTQIFAVPTQALSVEDLIINKQAAGRPQDLLDVAELKQKFKS